MTEDPNPYAPPVADALEAEEKDFPWYVAARGIYVTDDATLPRIDLNSGASGDGLVEQKHAFIMPGTRNLKVPTIIGCLGIGALVAVEMPQAWKITGAASIGLIYSFYVRGSRHFIRFVHFREEQARTPAVPAKTIWRALEICTTILSIIALATAFQLQMPWALAIFAILTFLSQFARKRGRRIVTRGLEIREAGGKPGWVRIGGAHPAAIAKLEEIQKLRGPLEMEPEASR